MSQSTGSVTMRERNNYVILGGGEKEQWLRMEWQPDIQKEGNPTVKVER